MIDIRILPAEADAAVIGALAAILVETVAQGGSVSFMHPLAPARAEEFWRKTLADPGRIVFAAFQEGLAVGTITLVLGLPENQPHRAEIAKMMVHPAARGRGIASALLREAEAEARAQGRTHLLLDTATDGGAGGLYERHGFQRAGEVPDFALKPHGGLTGTLFYWKRIA